MIFDKDTAKKTAEVLLQINAIKLSPQRNHLLGLLDGNLQFIVIIVLYYPFHQFVITLRETMGKHILKENMVNPMLLLVLLQVPLALVCWLQNI